MTGDGDSLQAHIDAAAPPGSTAYYALLFSPESARRSVGALMALSHELEQLAGKNPETAAFRLNWWAEELQRLGLGRPSHPVTSELQRCGQNDAFAMIRLGDRFKAASFDIGGTRYATTEDLTLDLRRRHGSMQSLMVRVLGSEPDRFPDYAEHLGIALGLGHMIATAPGDAAAGRLRLPDDILSSHGIEARDLAGNNSNPAVTVFAQSVAKQITTFLDRAVEALPAAERALQRTGLVQAALLRRIASLLAGTPPDRWLATAQLGGIAPLWLAWRTARRAGRGRL